MALIRHFGSRNAVELSQFPLISKNHYATKREEPDDILQRSVVPSDFFQKSLPRIKVPPLDSTLKKYLRSQEAFLPDQESLARCHQAVKEFQTKEGPELQKQLQAYTKANPDTSYISEMWFDMYLKDRRPTILTHQPFLLFNPAEGMPDANKTDIRATNLIFSAVRFLRSLEQNLLEPDVYHLNPKKSQTPKYLNMMRLFPQSISWYASYLMYKAFPLDMSQHKNLFFSTRVPMEGRDQLVKYPDSKHILVIYKEHMYTFDILTQEGRAVSPAQLLSNIRHILTQVEHGPGLGNYTSLGRDEWCKIRKQLSALPDNAEALHMVDSAAFVLVLDEQKSNSVEDLAQIFLHGNAGDRWFDKSFSLVLNIPSEQAGLTFEHSWGDGAAVMRFFNEIQEDSLKRPVVGSKTDIGHPDQQLPLSQVRRLTWNMGHNGSTDPSQSPLATSLQQAKDIYDKWRGHHLFHALPIPHFSRKQAKQTKIGADAIMQLSFQMAYFKLHNAVPATYESCSNAAFKHGRTETIRPATLETKAYLQGLAKELSLSEMYELLSKCSDWHNKITKEAAMAQGWDRHLFALRNYNQRQCSDKPENIAAIFRDAAYQAINHIRVSTSTLSSPHVQLGGFAAVVRDGYGIGYRMSDNECGVSISAWEGNGTYPQQMCEAISDSIKHIATVINHHNKKEKV